MKKFICSILLAAITAGCTPMEDETPPPEKTEATAPATRQQVTGTVAYREKMLLRPGSVLEVSLQQTSPADAPAKTLATQIIDTPPAPPIPFVLEYDPAEIDDRMSYSVRAKITRGDRLLFTTDTHYPVLTRGAGNSADLMLIAPAKPAQQPTQTPDAPFTNTYWKLAEIQGETYSHTSKNREPHIQFGKQQGSVNGFAGCNNFVGGYTVNGDKLEMEIAATQRACMEGMDTEQAMLKALSIANRYEITGDTLKLFADENAVLGFEAVYLQ